MLGPRICSNNVTQTCPLLHYTESVGCHDCPRGVYKVIGAYWQWTDLATARHSNVFDPLCLPEHAFIGCQSTAWTAHRPSICGLAERHCPGDRDRCITMLLTSCWSSRWISTHSPVAMPPGQAFRPPRITYLEASADDVHFKSIIAYLLLRSDSLRALGTPKAHHHCDAGWCSWQSSPSCGYMRWHAGLAVAICVWAAGTALSRCLMGRHYLGDVLAGALTGVATAATLSKVLHLPAHLP